MEKDIINFPYPPTFSLQAPTPTNQQQQKYTEYTSITKAHWEIYIFRLSSSAVHTEETEWDKEREFTICWAYSCQTQPNTFVVDKLWATSKSHWVYNWFNIFPFSGGDLSHSQEINIKYCFQHNVLASPVVLLCRMRPTEQHVTEQMADPFQKSH